MSRDRRTASYGETDFNVSPSEDRSYFAHSVATLDPRLFDAGRHLNEEIRQGLLSPIVGWFRTQGYLGVDQWLRVYLAGSAITYLWRNTPGGDLDVLLGIDHVEFRRLNPRYRGLSDMELAEHINTGLRADLWTKMCDWHGFEVTYYLNPHSDDIRSINPYAAYDVRKNSWVVEPDQDMPDPETRFPNEYREAAAEDESQAMPLIATAQALTRFLADTEPGSPKERTYLAQLSHTVKAGAHLFEEIHGGRREAFSPTGKGYWDYSNYRWQAAKRGGWITPLSEMAKLHGLSMWNPDEYGDESPSGRTALIRALLR